MNARILKCCLGSVGLLTLLAACSSREPQSPAKVASEQSAETVRLDDAAQLVTEFRGTMPSSVATHATCVVVVPSLAKAGLIVGGQLGHGFAACLTPAGWSGPAPVTVAGGTLGAQIGFQSTDVLAIVTNEAARRALESGNLNVGVDASATAGPVGTGSPSADVGAMGDVLTYSRSNGLFAGAILTGTTIKADEDATSALYGAPLDGQTILEGRAGAPQDPAAHRFTAALRAAFPPGQHIATAGVTPHSAR